MSASAGTAMMQFDGGRLSLAPQLTTRRPAALEVVMLGHCAGDADLRYLFDSADVCDEIAALGYARRLDALKAGGAATDPLYRIPVPVRSLAEFQRLFPATGRRMRYRSRIAGARPWLPQAVADFFAADGGDSAVSKKLWVINVDESKAQDGFLPLSDDSWLQPDNNSAFTRALMIPTAGVLAMPDLERLQIPSQLAGIPKLRLPNPPPGFLPCDADLDDGVRERRDSEEMLDFPEPCRLGDILTPMLRTLARHRPDMHLLLAVPFDRQLEGESPRPSEEALADLRMLQDSDLRRDLHRVQLTYPYLVSKDMPAISASALLAGAMAETTARQGAWRSVAGRPLPGAYQPLPIVSLQQCTRLRDEIGIGVLRTRQTRLQLDDERLAGGVFGEMSEASRSGEVARFLGWLHRELERLGRQLLFNVDAADARAMIVLQDFFTHLYQLGALRGRVPEQAFEIREAVSDATMIFDIALAPAFPIDRIHLKFSPERLEVRYG